MTSINKRMGHGILWMLAARLMDRTIGIVSTLFLARLLVPADFGLVAMATAIGGALELLGAFSFDLALIQKKHAERRHYDTVWTFNFIFAMVCALGLIVLAVPAAKFYSEPRLTLVMYALSVSSFLGAFVNVGVVDFRKNLDFRQEFISIFMRRVVTFVVTISAAFMLRSYWALLLGMTVGRAVSVGLSYSMNTYRPRFSLAAAKELFHFSKWMFVNNTLGFLRHDGCTFIIGRVFGATGLGVYSVAYEIANLPSSELVAPINRVTFPGFSKMQGSGEIAESYFRLLGIITLLILPVGIGIAAVAEPLVLAALGTKWTAAIPLIAVLGISGAITATQTNNASVWLSMGRPQEVTIVQACYLLVLFPSLYFFVHRFGMVGAGYAYLLAQTVDVVLEMRTTQRLLQFRWSRAFAVVWRPVVAVAVMYFAVVNADPFVQSFNPVFRLLLDSVFGAFVYAATILLLWLFSAKPESAETFCLRRAKLL